MRYILTFVLIIAAVFQGIAQEERSHNRVSISGTLTSADSYSLEAEYHYMFFQWIGVGGALGYWQNYFVDGHASGPHWSISDDDEEPCNIYLRPSVVLRSPGATIKGGVWRLFAEPGLMFNLPYQRVCIDNTTHWPETKYDYVSTSAGQWLAFELRAGLSVDIDQCSISAGYMLSTLDIYSQYRHLSYQGTSFACFYPNKTIMQGAFLSLSYNF